MSQCALKGHQWENVAKVSICREEAKAVYLWIYEKPKKAKSKKQKFREKPQPEAEYWLVFQKVERRFNRVDLAFSRFPEGFI